MYTVAHAWIAVDELGRVGDEAGFAPGTMVCKRCWARSTWALAEQSCPIPRIGKRKKRTL